MHSAEIALIEVGVSIPNKGVTLELITSTWRPIVSVGWISLDPSLDGAHVAVPLRLYTRDN